MDPVAVENSVKQKKARKAKAGKLAKVSYETETRQYFESIKQVPILYIEVRKVAEPYVYLDLRNLIILLIYESLELYRWVDICIVSKHYPSSCQISKSTLLRLKSSIVFHEKTKFLSESCDDDISSSSIQQSLRDIFSGSKRTHPSITVADRKLIICGLSSVLRFMFKYTCFRIESKCESNNTKDLGSLSTQLKQYLGFRGGCLQACAESSIWTKFCEVEMINVINEIILSFESVAKVNLAVDEIKFPETLMRFEHHLSLPVKIHNFRKVVQDFRKSDKTDETVDGLCNDMKAIDITDLKHEYAEGPTLLLSDLILYPSVHACINLLGRINFQRFLPISLEWYDKVQSHLRCPALPDVNYNLSIVNNGLTINLTAPEVKIQSLYSRDPNRYKPTLRQFTRQCEIDEALLFLKSNNVSPLEMHEDDPCFKWDDIPLLAHPEAGSLPVSRQSRKCEQLASMAYYTLKVFSRKTEQCNHNRDKTKPFRIVDFCSGGGHLGILVAWLLPQSEVILVENKDESLRRAQERIRSLGLSNVYFYQSNLDYFESRFDLGLALHACGTATDLVLKKCVAANASFVCCPCCYGAMQENHVLNYPRSASFHDIKIPLRHYFTMCHASDHTHDKAHEKTNQGKTFMAFVDTDRCLYAQDNGYEVELCKIVPETASPKNHILVGISST